MLDGNDRKRNGRSGKESDDGQTLKKIVERGGNLVSELLLLDCCKKEITRFSFTEIWECTNERRLLSNFGKEFFQGSNLSGSSKLVASFLKEFFME